MNTDQRQLISIVVPVFDEERVLPAFHKRLTDAIANLPLDIEIGASRSTSGKDLQ